MNEGTAWVIRRLDKITLEIEQVAGDIDPMYYPNSHSFITDVIDTTLNRIYDESPTGFGSDYFTKKYTEIIAALEIFYGNDLEDYYNTFEEGSINESFDKILDIFRKKNNGEQLKPSEKDMIISFKKFTDKGGEPEDFFYDVDDDSDFDDREGMKFKYNLKGRPFKFEFSEEIDKGNEIEYYGEITFNGDEYLGVIVTDKKGYLVEYDFYDNLSEDDIRLQDILKKEGSDFEIQNFFQETVIRRLRQ